MTINDENKFQISFHSVCSSSGGVRWPTVGAPATSLCCAHGGLIRPAIRVNEIYEIRIKVLMNEICVKAIHVNEVHVKAIRCALVE